MSDRGLVTEHLSHQEIVRRELTRVLGLTILYKAAVDDLARVEVVLEIRAATESALESLGRLDA